MNKGVGVAIGIAAILAVAYFVRGPGIPITAKPHMEIKGLGLYWSWRHKLSNGCVHWVTASKNTYVRAYFVSGTHSCEALDIGVSTREGWSYVMESYFDEIRIFHDGGPKSTGGNVCPFSVSQQVLADLQRMVIEAEEKNSFSHGEELLRKMKPRIDKLSRKRLTTDAVGGCNDTDSSGVGLSGALPPRGNGSSKVETD
ncbi:hypothetical protein N8940_02215 [Sphingomonadaceae bacterium]|nr:hypothetical protein [Sphingomonadaceae bacterium]